MNVEKNVNNSTNETNPNPNLNMQNIDLHNDNTLSNPRSEENNQSIKIEGANNDITNKDPQENRTFFEFKFHINKGKNTPSQSTKSDEMKNFIVDDNEEDEQPSEDEYDEPEDEESAYTDEEDSFDGSDEEEFLDESDEDDEYGEENHLQERKKYESIMKHAFVPISPGPTKKGSKKKKKEIYEDIFNDDIQEDNIIDTDINAEDDEKLAKRLSRQRVSLRSKKKINYAELDSFGEEFLEDEYDEMEANQYEEAVEEDTGPKSEEDLLVEKSSQIEKILAYRIEKKKTDNKPQENNGSPSKKCTFEDEVDSGRYEYLVKYKEQSYIKCEWVTPEFIEKARLGKQRLQRFHNKSPELDPDPPFDPEFVEVDRILAKRVEDNVNYYFVKWQGLPYNECTWESEDDIKDPEKVQQYEKINAIPSDFVDSNEEVKVPPFSEFKKLEKIDFKNENELRPYQMEGVNWLIYCWFNRRNSILADEMGLGKTIQSVSILWYLQKYQNIRGPFLVIAPLSTIPHWRREFETWTDMNCVVYHGNSQARENIRKYEWNYTDENGNIIYDTMYKFNVIVTTYEMVLTDSDILSPINWKYVVIDEAHRLKNKASRVLNEFLNFKYSHLLLLTGTPIQNNTQELWTLLNLLDPASFPDVDLFLKDFGNLKDASQVTKLHEILKPYLLRRMKEDVEKSLAPKEETIIEVELTTIQKKYYKAILEKNFDHLVGSRSRAALPSLLNVMMQLRKCCNHPFLLKGVEDAELEILSNKSKNSYETLIESSGKLVLIDKLLPRLKEEGHKVLIFSQMVRVLDILEDYMNYRGYKHERLDGGVRGPERQAAIDRFSRDKDILVFLLCTRAGGVGINLTAADTVIIFDSDWNPQNDLQAQARCHRIGQDKAVKVYRLLTRNTYERNMFERASLKLGLDKAVLNRSHDEDGESKPKFTTQEVDSLLKYGVYDLFRDDDSVSEKFREEDIEDIFARRTTKVIHEPGKAGSTFSKASFVSKDSNKDLDIDDPDFWKKVMPDVAEKPDPNIIYYPRQRKQLLKNDDKMDLEGNYDDSEFYGSRSRRKSDLNKRSWTITQRNRFIKTLTLLGFGRWNDIKKRCNFANKTIKDLALYGRAYIRKIIEFANIKDESEEEVISRITNCEDRKEDFTENGENLNIDIKECESEIEWFAKNDPNLNESKFLESLKSGAAQTLKRFELLVEIGDLVRSNFGDVKTFPVVVEGGRFFDSWWGMQEDRDLLIGTYKWGFGKYDKMIKDPELCFYNRVEPKPKLKRGAKSRKSDDDEDDIDEEEDEENIQNDAVEETEVSKDNKNTEQKEEQKSDTNNEPLKEMPLYKLLTHRVKHLLKAFSKKRLQERKRKEREKSFKSPRQRKKAKRK